MNTEFCTAIKESLSAKALLLQDEPLAPVTSFHIGGPAECLLIPSNKEDVSLAINAAKEHCLPWRLLGSGSNVIVPDKGLPGLTIKFWHNFDSIQTEAPLITAEAGVDMLNLSRSAAKAGLAGLEWACGIPGTVGGAVYMNAGVKEKEIKDTLYSAEVLDDSGHFVILKNQNFKFSYRTSILQSSPYVLVSATFRLKSDDPEKIFTRMNEHLGLRSHSQPIHYPNCGSVFRNPPGDYAGRLIETCGLKGYSIGGVGISEQHANFIVNINNGTAEDVLSLISHVKEVVFQRYGIELQEEVRVLQ